MRIVDGVGIVVILLVIVLFAAVIARQRHMLRSAGGIPLAVRGRGNRWQYGVGRYDGDELQWFRALGIGTSPSRSPKRDELRVLNRHVAADADLASLPPTAIIVECTDSIGPITLGFAEGAYTGFVSWLESSAPRF